MSDLEKHDDPVNEDPRVLQALERERRHLQKIVALVALVPVVAGLYGALFGPALTGERLSLSGDSHYRYLAGLHFGVGLLFWSTIPNIEAVGPRFRLLTLLVFIGGLSRFLGMTLTGVPSLYMLGALVMELVITPLLCLWQWRVARGYLVQEKKPEPRRSPHPTPAPAPAAESPPPSATSLPRAPVPPDDLPEPIPTPPPRTVEAVESRPTDSSGPAGPERTPSPPIPATSGQAS